jgi:hypothetical protein
MAAQPKIKHEELPPLPATVSPEVWDEPAETGDNPVHRLQRQLADEIAPQAARGRVRLSALVTVPLAVTGLCLVAPLSLFPTLFDSRGRHSRRTILRTLLASGQQAIPALLYR